MNDVGSKLQHLGVTLTFAITLPLIGFVLFGLIGLVIGLVMAAAFFLIRR